MLDSPPDDDLIAAYLLVLHLFIPNVPSHPLDRRFLYLLFTLGSTCCLAGQRGWDRVINGYMFFWAFWKIPT